MESETAVTLINSLLHYYIRNEVLVRRIMLHLGKLVVSLMPDSFLSLFHLHAQFLLTFGAILLWYACHADTSCYICWRNNDWPRKSLSKGITELRISVLSESLILLVLNIAADGGGNQIILIGRCNSSKVVGTIPILEYR